MAELERRRDTGEVRERLASLETILTNVVSRLHELGERSHAQGTALTAVVLNVEHLVGKIEDIIETQNVYRQAAAAEHQALRDELMPLKADYFDRRAVAKALGERETRALIRHPLFIAVIGAVSTMGAGWIAWLAWKFGWGRP